VTTRIHFNEKLEELQRTIVEMGTKTIKSIEDAILAFVDMDLENSQRIVDEDIALNQMEVNIYDSSAKLIAEEQPVARDLRIILNTIKASHVLERVADSAVHIAKSTLLLAKEGYVKPLVDIPRMAKIVMGMLRDAVDSYTIYDTEAAREIANRDEQVDDIYAHIFKELITYMHEDPAKIEQCMTLLFICRRLERIGDQTTHICEGIIYVAEGRDVDLNN
jgi:phosphate transport system protein